MDNKKYKPQLIARESAIKILYQMKMQDESIKDVMSSFIEKRDYDETLLRNILIRYVDNKEQIISLLNEKTDVSLDNIPVLDECIIHLGICEFIYINNSKNIIINEYINLAK